MVNKLQRFLPHVVKTQLPGPDDKRATAKGGLAIVQMLANRLRLWSDIGHFVPRRKDPTQGYPMELVLGALMHGLLSGGQGFQATEPLRGDTHLLRLLGMSAAPSAETVEGVIKYLAEVSGSKALNQVLLRQARRVLERMDRKSLLEAGHGFVTLWLDGTVLEVKGKKFEAIKNIKGKHGQLCVAGYVGPCLAAVDFAPKKVGEETLVRGFLADIHDEVIAPLRLGKNMLILLDSLHGDGPTFDQLEALPDQPAFIVGVQKLTAAQDVMAQLPEAVWRETGPDPKRGWAQSAWAQAWVCCDNWTHKRPMICHRWVKEGEMVTNYAAIVTYLDQNDTRVAALMEEWKLPLEETLWKLYSSKQGLENLWKELLADMGLHHPPSAKVAVNAVFYAVAALAYNLAVGVRQLGFTKAADKAMRLWRFRREVIDVAASVVSRARQATARLLDARDHLIRRLWEAMQRLARC